MSKFLRMDSMPLVVVMGCTGVGKSSLGLSIAERFKGEIINADSMQIYRALPITTNQPSKDDMSRCGHHLFHFVSPATNDFSIRDYRMCALSTIYDVSSRNRLPVIVGGTNYYIESLLRDRLLSDVGPLSKQRKSMQGDYDILNRLDPRTAAKLHPHDRRHIQRAIEFAERTGTTISEAYLDQHRISGSSERGQLRFCRSLILWLDCEKEELLRRVRERTERMIKDGMLEEMVEFTRSHECLNSDNFESGIFQCIGLKQFKPYIDAVISNKQSEDALERQKQACISEFVVKTMQYSRTQLKWLRRRFLTSDGVQQNPPVYRLDCTDAGVFDRAIDIVTALTNNEQCKVKPEGTVLVQQDPEKRFARNVCQACNNRIFVTQAQWEAHLLSKEHKRLTRIASK